MTEQMLASLTTSQPWWRTDDYSNDVALPDLVTDQAGPHGVALVKVWASGKTDEGWGLEGKEGKPGFMALYPKLAFAERKALYGYERDRWAFAIVMRSVRMVCIDIDGKNGGLEHARRLGALPPTLAETSKSGNGYHLFYLVDDEWDDEVGFAALSDHIGIEQGVDIRSVGCVFHHKQQQWNWRPPVPLPNHLKELMLARKQRTEHQQTRITKVIQSGDEMETIMLHDELTSDLAKPIAQGKRNTTLFAIGQKMKQAGVPDWEAKVGDRATQVGLDADEVDQLVRNIQRYN